MRHTSKEAVATFLFTYNKKLKVRPAKSLYGIILKGKYSQSVYTVILAVSMVVAQPV
jgi:hypothetical protein